MAHNWAKLPKHLTYNTLSHGQKVCILYKNILMELKGKYPMILVYRYQSVLMRERFERNRHIKDLGISKAVLEDGYRELFEKRIAIPLRMPNDPLGVAYQRDDVVPDYILDTWHPLEKQQYPDYFAKRDQRKKEYIDRWVKKYGHSEHEDSSAH